jgi:hypothetical protein
MKKEKKEKENERCLEQDISPPCVFRGLLSTVNFSLTFILLALKKKIFSVPISQNGSTYSTNTPSERCGPSACTG